VRQDTNHGSSSHSFGRGRLATDRASKLFGRGVLLFSINDEQHSAWVVAGGNL
jgi:hypothetical protein